MPKRSDTVAGPSPMRDKIIGLGERSIRKSYYPLLLRQLSELEASRNRLVESEARYRSLVENINEIIFTLDVAGNVTYVSPMVRRLDDATPAEVIGKSFMAFVHPDDRSAIEAGFKRVLAGAEEPHEFRLVSPRGGVRHVRTSSRPLLEEGRIVGLTGLMADVTEQKQSERALRESDARYRRIVDTAVEGIWMLNQDYLTVFVNGSMATMLGYPAAEMIGRPYAEFLFEEDLADHRQRMASRRQGLSEQYERRFRCRDGHTVWTLASATPVVDEAQRFCGSFAMFTDITERKCAEAELARYRDGLEETVRQRTEELQAANRELESFAYSVSHDLRAPLRAIDGFSNILIEDCAEALGAEGRHYLEIVRSNTVRMAQLIDDLLSFSRMGRQDIKKAAIDMGRLVQEVFDELLSLQPSRRPPTLALAPLPACRGDPAMIRQVLVNLLSNAIKFTAKRADAKIEVGGEAGPEQIEYCVRDNGAGFDMQSVGRLFGVFQRLHLPGDFEGTGIGLAIVKRIIERHGGRVWAEGKLDAGAAFHFTLPMAS